jgi:hypothetical protein
MNRPRLIRWLRIAASVVCLVVCVELISLWIRSYWACDIAYVEDIGVISAQGYVLCGYLHTPDQLVNWGFRTVPASEWQNVFAREWKKKLRFNYGLIPGGFLISVPHWSLASTVAALAFAPWIPWSTRFSLRTLLIVTTLVVVVLGCVVWAVR